MKLSLALLRNFSRLGLKTQKDQLSFIISLMITPQNHQNSSKSLKIKHFTYGQQQSYSAAKYYRATGVEPNPIKVVVDMIGQDGIIHQKIIKQSYQLQHRYAKQTQFKFKNPVPKKYVSQPRLKATSFQKIESKDSNHRSIVFNCYNYDNYHSLPMPKGKNSSPSKRKISNPNHKNIEIVFCENKLPQFVNKTNQKIEQIYKQERILQTTQRKEALIKSQFQSAKSRQSFVKPAPKTNFANCLKEYSTLQKLSLFMQSDRNVKNKHFCHDSQNDPSRNLLLEIITHRFNFLKAMNSKIRDRIYRSLLSRQIHNQTKINIQEYMKLYEMFIGRDAKPSDVATFMYIFLFGNQVPTMELAADHLERLNGQLHRLRSVYKELQNAMQKGEVSLVQTLCNNEKLLRQFIDYIVER